MDKLKEIRKCLDQLHVNQEKRAELIVPLWLRPKLDSCSPDYIAVIHALLKENFPSKFE
jgi:hypothetical protein